MFIYSPLFSYDENGKLQCKLLQKDISTEEKEPEPIKCEPLPYDNEFSGDSYSDNHSLVCEEDSNPDLDKKKETPEMTAEKVAILFQETLLCLERYEEDISELWDYIQFLGDLAHKEVTSARLHFLENNKKDTPIWAGIAVDVIFAVLPFGGAFTAGLLGVRKVLSLCKISGKEGSLVSGFIKVLNKVDSNEDIYSVNVIKDLVKVPDTEISNKIKSSLSSISNKGKKPTSVFSIFHWVAPEVPSFKPDVEIYKMIYEYVDLMKFSTKRVVRKLREDIIRGKVASIDDIKKIKKFLEVTIPSKVKEGSYKEDEKLKYKLVLRFELQMWAKILDWKSFETVRSNKCIDKTATHGYHYYKYSECENVDIPTGLSDKVWDYFEERFINSKIDPFGVGVLKKYKEILNRKKMYGSEEPKIIARSVIQNYMISLSESNDRAIRDISRLIK